MRAPAPRLDASQRSWLSADTIGGVSAHSITDRDVTALDSLTRYIGEVRASGLGPGIARLKAGLVDELERAEAVDVFGDSNLLEVDDGVDACRANTSGGSRDAIGADPGEES